MGQSQKIVGVKNKNPKLSFRVLSGERGTCQSQNTPIKSILHSVFYLSDTSTDTSLLGYNYLKFKVLKYKDN